MMSRVFEKGEGNKSNKHRKGFPVDECDGYYTHRYITYHTPTLRKDNGAAIDDNRRTKKEALTNSGNGGKYVKYSNHDALARIEIQKIHRISLM